LALDNAFIFLYFCSENGFCFCCCCHLCSGHCLHLIADDSLRKCRQLLKFISTQLAETPVKWLTDNEWQFITYRHTAATDLTLWFAACKKAASISAPFGDLFGANSMFCSNRLRRQCIEMRAVQVCI